MSMALSYQDSGSYGTLGTHSSKRCVVIEQIYLAGVIYFDVQILIAYFHCLQVKVPSMGDINERLAW